MESKEVTIAEMILSEDWEIINVLMNQNGFTRIKARRIRYDSGNVNIVQKWCKSVYAKKLYRDRFKKDISTIGQMIQK